MAETIGPYVVLDEISRGGTAIVYRAYDPANGQQVALKVLHDIGMQTVSVRKRFEREAEALSRLSHPGIVKVFGWGTEGHYPYLALELIHGKSLETLLEAGPLRVPLAVRYARELAGILEHAHGAGVLHRDLKPANVLVTPRGRVVLTDFGLARDQNSADSRLSEEGSFMGSPGFWSPEQARGDLDAVGPHTDLYGLGATLYAMLTARPPLEVRSLPENLMLTELEPPPPPSRYAPTVDAALDGLVLQPLAKDPSQRPLDAKTYGKALETWLRGSVSFYSLRAVVGDRRLWGAGLLAALSLVALLGVALWLNARAPEPPGTPTSGADDAVDPRVAEAAKLVDLDPERVERLCSDVLAEGPDAQAYFYRGVVRFGSGRLELALADFERGCDLNPERATLQANRGYVLYNLQRLDEGIAAIDRAIELDPDEPEYLLHRADMHFHRGALLESLADAQRVTEISPDDPEGWERCEQALRALGRDDAADAAWTRFLQLSPSPALAYLRRGRAALMLRDLPRARDLLERAREADGENPEVLTELGEVRMLGGQFQRALETLNAALALAPQSQRALRTRGIAFRALGKLDASDADLSQVLDQQPQDVLARHYRALNALDRKLPSVALRDLQTILEHDPRHTGALTSRANVYRMQGDYARALDDVATALESAPQEALPYAARAAILQDQGKRDEALADWRRALERSRTVAERQLAQQRIEELSKAQ